MPGHVPYATRAFLEDRLSKKIVLAILDDNHDATPDPSVVATLLRDATSYVDSYLALAPASPLPLDPLDLPDIVVRLTIDVAEWMAAKRFPEVMRKDWKALKEAVDEELERIRDGKTAVVTPAGSTALEGPVASSCEPRYGCCDLRGGRDGFYNNDD